MTRFQWKHGKRYANMWLHANNHNIQIQRLLLIAVVWSLFALAAISCGNGDSAYSAYTDDYLEEYYIDVQAGLQDAAALSGIPIGGLASRTEFNVACELLEAMGYRHNNTNNLVYLMSQEPEKTSEQLNEFEPPFALIAQIGRTAAAALRAGAVMGAIEGDPSYSKNEQKALCEYIADR